MNDIDRSRRRRRPARWAFGASTAVAVFFHMVAPAPLYAQPRHAIAMHGEPAWPDGFSAAPYVNAQAPQGGRLTQGVLGTFDTLNPFTVKGLAPTGMRAPFVSASNVISGYVIESLMTRGYDEPFTLYGLLARSIETDEARRSVTFTLDERARFADGSPVTADDVLFTWQLLRDKGRPNYRLYYAKVRKAEVLGERVVRFDLDGDDRELPLILGLMPVFSKRATDADRFEETSFAAPLGSGPYVVADVDPGRALTLKRNTRYWGRDLPINRGLWNFDELRFDYYRDANVALEAFRNGLYDIRAENDPGKWKSGYDGPALRAGRIVKETFSNAMPKAMLAYAFNTRRPLFADIRVREALALLFDFEWLNHNLFFDLYRRTSSFFAGSELSSHGRPADAAERALLAPYLQDVREDVLNGTWSPPVTDGSGRDRTTLKRALALLTAAGFALRGSDLVDTRSGKLLAFEIMVVSKDDEKLALLFATQLKRAGITAQVRIVDAVQFEARRINFDFDVIPARWDQSLSPGNEQSFYWSSDAADAPGSRNYMGIKSQGVDAMIAALLAASDRSDVVTTVRALDRLLISGSYIVPLFHAPEQWVARSSSIRHPAATSKAGYLPESWWRAPSQE